MKIEEINLYSVSSSANLSYGLHKRSSLTTIIVELRSGGVSGWGECSATKFKRFFDPLNAAKRLSKAVLKRTLSDPSIVLTKKQSLPIDKDPWSFGYDGAFRSAREAFSIAAYDLYGKLHGKPVYNLLGKPKRLNFAGMPVIHIQSPLHMAEISKRWVEMGYEYLKIKLGHDQTIERLKAIRDAIGMEVDLHVDFNLSCNPKEILKHLNDLHSRFNISVIEDPIRINLRKYKSLKDGLQTSLMIDTGVFYPRIKKIAKVKSCDIINHHTDRQGGLDLALLISKEASKFGITDAVGSSGVAGVSEVAFQALSTQIGLGRPCESILFSNYSNPIFEGYYGTQRLDIFHSLHSYESGNINLLPIPGLGLDVDRKRLSSLSDQTFHFH